MTRALCLTLVGLILVACNPVEELAKCPIQAKKVSFSHPLDSSLVTVLFQVVDCNGKPVTGLTMDQVKAVEVVDGQIYELSPTETKRDFYPKGRAFGTLVSLAFDYSASIYANPNPELLPTLRASVLSLTNSLLSQNQAGQNPEVVLNAAAFDGEEQPFPVISDPMGVPHFISSTEFQDSFNSQIQCGLPSPLVGDCFGTVCPPVRQPLCEDGSTNLYGTSRDVINSTAMMAYSIPGIGWTSPDYVSRVAVIFTDGREESNLARLSDVENALNLHKDVKVYTVGLKGEVDEAALQTIGRDGTFWADNVEGLQTAFQNVRDEIRDVANSFYLFQYCTAKRRGTIQLVLGHPSEIDGKTAVELTQPSPSTIVQSFTATTTSYCPL